MEIGQVVLKGKLRSEFGNAMSYRALKRQDPLLAAEWRIMLQDIRKEFKAAEDVLLASDDKAERIGLLFGVLNYAADEVTGFNRASGLKAEMHTEFKLMGKTVMKAVTKPEL